MMDIGPTQNKLVSFSNARYTGNYEHGDPRHTAGIEFEIQPDPRFKVIGTPAWFYVMSNC